MVITSGLVILIKARERQHRESRSALKVFSAHRESNFLQDSASGATGKCGIFSGA